MYRWMIARFARWALTEAVTGRPGPALWSMADDIRFVFPGSSSLACDVVGKDHVAAWLQRLIALGPDYRVLDVIVSGPPWNTRAAIRFCDTVEGHANEGMHYLKLRWGKIILDQLFLDTEIVTAWERERRADPARRGDLGSSCAQTR